MAPNLCYLAPALKESLPHSMCKPEEGRITNNSQQAGHLAEEAIQESVHVRMRVYQVPYISTHGRPIFTETVATKLQDIFMTLQLV